MSLADIQKYLEEMQTIQNSILDYIEDENGSEDNLRDIQKYINDQKIRNNIHKLKLFLRLITKIINNHHRGVNFFTKIEKIIQLIKDLIINNFSNSEIFHIFKGNKRILLYLVEEKIMTFDKDITDQLEQDFFKHAKYQEYFYPELKQFLDFESTFIIEEFYKEIYNKDFNEKRKNGENESLLSKMIREDSVEEFIIYANQTNMPLSSLLNKTIYETNSFLLKQKEGVSLIEYAAFFGAIQIFQFLKLNRVELKSNLWLFAIHGKNAEMIHLLEESQIDPPSMSHNECLNEAIKCHHNDIANYFETNFMNEENCGLDQAIKSFNFDFIQIDPINQSSFYFLCHKEYYDFVDNILKIKKDIDVNTVIVSI